MLRKKRYIIYLFQLVVEFNGPELIEQHKNVYDINNGRCGVPQKAISPALDIPGPERHNGSGTSQTDAYEKNQLTGRSEWQHVANEHDGM